MKEAVVIGAGPAGSLAAYLLGRAGWRITLVEQHRFPRNKVCGECLSALGIGVLQRAGIPPLAVAPIQLTHALIHSHDGSTCDIALPRPMWGISRHVLDDHLLNAARSVGVNVLQPARCESHHPEVIVRDLVTNEVQSVHADIVIIADGKSRPSTSDFGIKTHFADVDGPRNAIELFGGRGHYGGLAPIESDLWNAAFSVPASRMRRDIDGLFAEISAENSMLAERLRNAHRVTPWLVSPLPRASVAKQWLPGVIPIGNAAAALEPVGGEGMGLALRSAELAAEMLSRVPFNPADLRSAYEKLWRVRSAACRALALGVSTSSLASRVVPFVNGCDGLVDVAMHLMGKTA